jgi:hypothetical protein
MPLPHLRQVSRSDIAGTALHSLLSRKSTLTSLHEGTPDRSLTIFCPRFQPCTHSCQSRPEQLSSGPPLPHPGCSRGGSSRRLWPRGGGTSVRKACRQAIRMISRDGKHPGQAQARRARQRCTVVARVGNTHPGKDGQKVRMGRDSKPPGQDTVRVGRAWQAVGTMRIAEEQRSHPPSLGAGSHRNSE